MPMCYAHRCIGHWSNGSYRIEHYLWYENLEGYNGHVVIQWFISIISYGTAKQGYLISNYFL